MDSNIITCIKCGDKFYYLRETCPRCEFWKQMKSYYKNRSEEEKIKEQKIIRSLDVTLLDGLEQCQE